MKPWTLMGTTACAAILAAQAAFADVTPEQVWTGWKDMATSAGQTVTAASESREGASLVVKGLSIASSGEGADATLTIDQVTFTDKGDGSVSVTASDSYPLKVRAAGEEGKADVLTTIDISHPGLRVDVSGSPDEMRYDFAAPTLSVKLAGVESPDPAEIPEDLVVEATVTALAGNYIVAGAADGARSVSSNATADAFSMILQGTDTSDPGNASKISAKVTLTQIAGTSTGKSVGDMANMAAALKAGMAAEGNFTYGGTTMDMTVAEATGETKVSSSASGGDVTFALDAGQMAYGGKARDMSMTMSGGDLPVPQISMAYKEGAFNFAMPVSKSDAPAPFGFGLKLADLTVSDELWNMFDPGMQLPRDPMTVIVDTTGTATLNVDLMDDAAIMAMGDASPGALNSLDIKALQVKMAGADVTGSGALTFDNGDLVTYGGFPAPTGTISLKAMGLNGLLDKLTAMGLVPEDQVMGARMMLGMFAKVVEGQPDTMVSDLEFKDKHFFANGMQLQ